MQPPPPRTVHLASPKFGVCWWNTGLSPLSRARAIQPPIAFAISTIVDVVSKFGIDLIALGEVSEADLAHIKEGLDPRFVIHLGREDAQGLFFDTALLYRGDKFDVLDSQTQSVWHGRAHLKVGELIKLFCNQNKVILNLVVSHWNSRIFLPEEAPPRDAFGTAIKILSDGLIAANQPYFLILGDFNDEPFCRPLAGNMLATQDRALALDFSGYLYNPFWRLLGESTHSKFGIALDGRGGTYLHHEGVLSRWKLFDQMLFSPEFLRPGPFMLDESSIGIVESEELLSHMYLKKGRVFDHLPVVAQIDLGVADE